MFVLFALMSNGNLVAVVRLVAFLALLGSPTLLAEDKVQKTMTVRRCQAILKDGKQCSNQATDGAVYCWKHKSEKSVKKAADDVSAGANKAWTSTKTWTTNAWESTKSGANKAWTSTGDAFSEAGSEFKKLFSDKKGADSKVKGK